MTSATLPPPIASLHPDALTEVEYGVVVEKDMGAKAIGIADIISQLFGSHVREKRLGQFFTEMMYVLDSELDLRRRPDVSFVSTATWPLDRELPETDWELIPDLVVEVVSTNDNAGKVMSKVDEYFSYGVKEVWVVYPTAQKAIQFVGSNQLKSIDRAGSLETTLIPGYALPMTELFPIPVQLPIRRK